MSPSTPEPVDPLVAQAESRLGQVLREKWRLERLFGVGGMAAVYAATRCNGAKAALKLLHRELGETKTRLQRGVARVNDAAGAAALPLTALPIALRGRQLASSLRRIPALW